MYGADEYRDLALWAYGEECGVCGDGEGEIHVRHILSGGMTDRLAELIPLGRSCHQYVHPGLPVEDPHLARPQSMVIIHSLISDGMVYDSRREQWYYEGEYLTSDEAGEAARAVGSE